MVFAEVSGPARGSAPLSDLEGHRAYHYATGVSDAIPNDFRSVFADLRVDEVGVVKLKPSRCF